jgi:hypothetical protein
MVPVCVYPTSQERRAQALNEHCINLDGTGIILIEQTQGDDDKCEVVHPENRFHSLQSHALRRAAKILREDFVWLEADSIPIKKRWLKDLEDEYYAAGKKFMISSDSQPHDLVGGIGCYCAETAWLVPVDYAYSGWDLWLIEHVPHLVHRTPSIQHSYGHYGPDGFVDREHRFPRDLAMIRPDAVIFHRDKHQDLIAHLS